MWSIENPWWRETGTRRLGELVERSQRMEDSLEGTETTRREGLLRRAVVSEYDGCKEESSDKFTCEVEG